MGTQVIRLYEIPGARCYSMPHYHALKKRGPLRRNGPKLVLWCGPPPEPSFLPDEPHRGSRLVNHRRCNAVIFDGKVTSTRANPDVPVIRVTPVPGEAIPAPVPCPPNAQIITLRRPLRNPEAILKAALDLAHLLVPRRL